MGCTFAGRCSHEPSCVGGGTSGTADDDWIDREADHCSASRPNTDLYLSPGHAILVAGALVTAGSLVNGSSIRSATEIAEPDYLHLELDESDLLYVHGVACESYVQGRAADMVLDASGARAQIASHLRSALSPWIEVRRPVDILRDRLAGL